MTPFIHLNDGNTIPQLGLGVYLTPSPDPVVYALQHGYRHIDTAQFYRNEQQVGDAIKRAGIPREQLWVTTKIWDSNQGYEQTTSSLSDSLRKLQLEYVDMVLLHSPYPGREKRLASWKALEDAKDAGLVRSIGVSNYGPAHLDELASAKYPPSVNQIEVTPFFQRRSIIDVCRQRDIHIVAYSPFGKGAHVDDPRLSAIASKYGKSGPQLLLRWSLQHGYIVIPKSANPARISANADVFDFDISADDMHTLDGMESGEGVTWDPTDAP